MNDLVEWEASGLQYTELARREYANAVVSAGFVSGHPVDTLYLRLRRDSKDESLLLRPDEAAAILWCLSGVLLNLELERLG